MTAPAKSRAPRPVLCGDAEMVTARAVAEGEGIAAADDGRIETIALETGGCAEIDAGRATSPISSITSKSTARQNIVTMLHETSRLYHSAPIRGGVQAAACPVIQ
jgi:hypothetical protein